VKKARKARKNKATKDVDMENPEAPAEGPADTPLEALMKLGFQIGVRKDQDVMSKPTNVFKILDPKEWPEINNFNQYAPYGKFAHPISAEFVQWMKDHDRKVLATIIGNHKGRDASYAFAKTTTLIQQAAAFVAKGNTKVQSMTDCDFVILETKDKETAQKLSQARLVHNADLNVVVLFREIQLTYNKIRSLTISFLTSPDMYNAFEAALEDELKIKVKTSLPIVN
jgi:hypothetical protein